MRRVDGADGPCRRWRIHLFNTRGTLEMLPLLSTEAIQAAFDTALQSAGEDNSKLDEVAPEMAIEKGAN